MIKLIYIYIGEYRKQDIYDLKSGDIYEFEETNIDYLYNVTQVRDGVSTYISKFILPKADNINFITLAEWREKQINSILEDE